MTAPRLRPMSTAQVPVLARGLVLGAVVSLVLALAGCGGGGGASNGATSASAAEPAPVDTAPRVLTCEAAVVRPIVGSSGVPGGVLINNMWNAESAGAGAGPRAQCLRLRTTAAGALQYGWSWQWPSTDGLYAYPSAIVGRSPWAPEVSNDARFPRTVAATRALWIDFDVELLSTGKQNLSSEYWFTAVPPRPGESGLPVKAELMIWSDVSDGVIAADDRPVDQVEIGGVRYDVHLQPNWGDASANKGVHWTFITYVAVERGTTARYDARLFFADAMRRGVITGTDHVSGVELGNEIVSGSGSVWLRRFTVTVE